MSRLERLALVGGGSGGHVYPLMALAQTLRERNSDTEVLFIGEQGRMEEDLLKQAGWEYELLILPPANAPAWRRAIDLSGWRRGYLHASDLLAEFGPQAVVASGGQVGVPVMAAARRAGHLRAMLEPNAVPGRANQIIARRSRPDLTVIAVPRARQHFPAGLRVEELGYPIRPAVLRADRRTSAAALGLDPERPTLLVFGGSQGSGHLNDVLIEALPRLRTEQVGALQVFHVGGWVNARTLAPEQVSNLAVSYHYRPYLHEMDHALATCDLALCRAGMAGMSELTARGVPAILVPLPQVSGHHQWYNARWMADAGAALVVRNDAFTADWLASELPALLGAPERLQAMAEASRNLGRPDASERILDSLETLLEK